jgi:hypothetical protein
MSIEVAIRLFWIKLFTVILALGLVIGYFGYKHTKPPAYVTLSSMVLDHPGLRIQVDNNTKHIDVLDHRLSKLEESQHHKTLDAIKNK